MVADSFNILLNEIALIEKQFHALVDTGFLIFSRMLGFVLIAPIFGRKDLPFTVKVSIAIMLTCILVWTFPAGLAHTKIIAADNTMWYGLQVFMNTSIGFLIGFIATTIMDTINAAGSLMNNQIGLSSAMMFDPGSRQQVALLEKLFAFIGLMVLFYIGGIYWIIGALIRSFEVFPLDAVQQDIVGKISLDYLIQITGNTLSIGLQLIAPVMVVTMAIDLILGIVNRTAQQIQVFQLSFALKPCIGLGAFLATLPIFIKLLENYLSDYASIF